MRTPEYEEYLKSDLWRSRRKRILARSKGICERCKKAKVSDIHHNTYARLFEELDSDLLGVCRGCHEAIHSKPAKKKPVYLKKPRAKVAKRARLQGRITITHTSSFVPPSASDWANRVWHAQHEIDQGLIAKKAIGMKPSAFMRELDEESKPERTWRFWDIKGNGFSAPLRDPKPMAKRLLTRRRGKA